MMKKKIVGMLAAGTFAAGALVLGVAGPASANPWYQSGFDSYSDCSWSAYGRSLQGYTITQGCTYRPYDGKWGYWFQYYRGHS
jgi:hypothetical protein